MDPVTLGLLAATTTAVALDAAKTLGTEAAKGAAGEAGKTLWAKIQAKLGWTAIPAAQDLPAAIARALAADPARAQAVRDELAAAGRLAPVVGHVTAEAGSKVIIAHRIDKITM